MSLDISLVVDGSEVFEANLTHNLVKMADKADLYKSLWCCKDYGISVAEDLIEHLEAGLLNLTKYKDELEKLNPENGWGSYENLLCVVCSYISHCYKYPKAEIHIWK